MQHKIYKFVRYFDSIKPQLLNPKNGIFITLFLGMGWLADLSHGQSTPANDPWVMKVYPDGTKKTLRWSEIGKSMDQGENHGGPPRIEPYRPPQQGIVPIGQSNSVSPSSQPPEQDSQASSQKALYKDVDEAATSKRMTRPIAFPDSTEQPYDWQKDRQGKEGIALMEEYDPDEVYGRIQVGPSFVTSQTINSINGLPTGSELSFDTGVRGGFEIGGHLSRYLALEGNISAIWNNSQQSSDGWLLQLPAMIGLNGEFPIPLEDGPRLIPYVGVDAGGSFMLYHNLEFVPQGQSTEYSDSFGFFTPVWQVRVGLMIEFRDNWAFTAGYSYLGSWGAIGEPVSSSNIQLGSIGTSSIDIGLRTFF